MVRLEGGCLVFAPEERATGGGGAHGAEAGGGARQPAGAGTRTAGGSGVRPDAWLHHRGTRHVRRLAGRDSGTAHVSLRLLAFEPGASPRFVNPTCDEALYVLSGAGIVHLAGGKRRAGARQGTATPYDVEANTGIFVAPGVEMSVHNPGPGDLLLASSRCPDPGHGTARVTAADEENDLEAADHPAMSSGHPAGPQAAPGGSAPPVVTLAGRTRETTSDRWYRVLLDGRVGSREVTQFVGAIPPGKAPPHFHEYEEVLVILAGEGIMWAGETCTEVRAGSCVYLPRRQVHSLENTGRDELRLLGVFYPAGSPAVAYDT